MVVKGMGIEKVSTVGCVVQGVCVGVCVCVNLGET